MRAYVALIRKGSHSFIYDVSFPDFPSVTAAAPTLTNAIKAARDALELHIEESGVKILPVPSSLGEIRADPENAEALAILVPAPAVGK